VNKDVLVGRMVVSEFAVHCSGLVYFTSDSLAMECECVWTYRLTENWTVVVFLSHYSA